MKNGKYQNGTSKRVLVLALALVLLLGCGIGGTIAWLMDTTDAVTNTFTVGDVDIELTETTGNDYKIIPGGGQTKDPKVTVKAISEDCWVFVKVENINNENKKYVAWEIADGWTELAGNAGVYYREYTGDTGAEYAVLKDNKVTYSNTLTKAELNALYETGTTTIDLNKQPKLVFTAYAVQKDNVADAATAWGYVAAR